MKDRTTASFVLGLCLSACADKGASAPSPNDACGATRCDNADWPQLVVAEAVHADAGTANVRVQAIIGGVLQDAYAGGDCPNGINVIDCQYQFWRAPADQTITLEISVDGGPATSRTIPMGAFNHCGNGLSYVHFKIVGDPPTVDIADPVKASPCRVAP